MLCSSDAGALAVINADLAASNLPKTSAFVPLLAELVEQMLDRRRGGRFGALRRAAGGPSADRSRRGGRAANPRAGRCRRSATGVAADSGGYGELVDEAAGAVWRWTTPGPPGVYRVERDGATVFALAVNIPAEESQLEVLLAEGADRPARRGPRGRLSRRRRREPAARRFLEVVRRGVCRVHFGRNVRVVDFPYVNMWEL